jgi:CMP-N,N'-diacetyllegionaminic acid synthase
VKKNKLNIVTLIPARKNSKGIRNKNIINFFGKPLIFYSINVCHKVKLINEIFVSTDSKKIKKISVKNKAKCPFLRPSHISKDNSTDLEVFKHFYKFYLKNYKKKLIYSYTLDQLRL